MSKFFALMARMKYIERWGLMRSSRKENIQEHSLQTAMVAHMLAKIGNKLYGKSYDENKIAVLAMYHEAGEILTGDLPTPIKYYNEDIRKAYKAIEGVAEKKIVALLPKEFQSDFKEIIVPENGEEKQIVKYADRICAYLKCVEEVNSGNHEFTDAMASIKESIDSLDSPEVKYFTECFTDSFSLTLDKLK